MKEKTPINPKGAGRKKGIKTRTIAFEADPDTYYWYMSLNCNKSDTIRTILKKHLTDLKL